MLTDNVIPFTIPNNDSLSEARDLTDAQISSLEMPSAWTAANLIVLACNTYDGTYKTVYDDSGVKASIATDANRIVSLSSNALIMAPLKFIKFKSVSTADNTTAVNQVGTAGARTYPITTNAVLTVQGVRTYPITTNAVATDTVTIAGQTFTAVESDPAAGQFVPGVDTTATATALKNVLNANATISALYTATDATGTITLTEKVAGGNTPPAATKTGTIVIGAGTVTNSKALPDTVTINGVTFTASAATQDATHFVVGADATATATNLKTALNANPTISALFTATDATGTVTLTEKVVGGLNNPTVATKTGTIVIGEGTATASVSGARTINLSVKR